MIKHKNITLFYKNTTKMERVINFNTVQDYNDFNNNETLYPLVTITDLSKADPRHAYKMIFNVYCIILKE